MDGNLFVVVTLGKVCANKPLNHTHEFDLDESKQDVLEACLDLITAREVDKIIHIQTQRVGHRAVWLSWVIWIADKIQVDTWIARVTLETHGPENFADLAVPVTWAAVQSVEGL